MKSSILHLIITCVLCVAVVVGYGFWYSTISAKSAEVTALQNRIDSKIASVTRLASTRALLEEIAGDEAIVQSYFVPETGVVAFIDALETRGRTLGAVVTVLSVGAENGTKQSLTLALSVRGTFDAVMRTVGAIEYAPYGLTISTLAVGQDTKNSWHADLKITVGSVSAKSATTTPTKP